MRVTFDTNTLEPLTQPQRAGALRAQCTAIHEALKTGRLQGFICETVVTLEGARTINSRVRLALDLGLQVLSAPRDGSTRIAELYAPASDEVALQQKFAAIAAAIEARGLGFACMAKASDDKSRARALAEWADGDSVAAHYAYANDLFCTQDRAVRAGRNSIMHPAHRGWLHRRYGVELIDLAGLAARLARVSATTQPS